MILPFHEAADHLETGQGEGRPALLVSYCYLRTFLPIRPRAVLRDWALDSGAFSAHQSGTVIDLREYIETAQRLRSEDPKLTEVFALDVIGDPRASRRNAEAMWEAGIEAVPCFHYGTPWPELISLAREYPKIALGGVALKRRGEKGWIAGQAFSRLWREVGPTRVHGFGFGSPHHIGAFPFESVDATNWETDPTRYGRWRSFGYGPTGSVSVRGGSQDLWAEIEYFLRLERETRRRRPEGSLPFTLRLALAGGGGQRYQVTFCREDADR